MNFGWCTRAFFIGAIVTLVSGMCVVAQEGGAMPPSAKGDRPSAGSSQGGPGSANRPPKPPLELALDANRDGTIDADEIANAVAALKKLDKNGDGKLAPDEYRPPRPPRDDGREPAGGPSGGRPNQANPPSGEEK